MKILGPGAMWKVTRSAFAGWSTDNCSSMGAALAFYSLLSMAPLLMLVITMAGLIIGHDEAQTLLLTQLSGLLGDTGAEGVKTMLEASAREKTGILATVISALVLLVGATTVFAELQDDLNRIWKCEPRKTNGVWGLLRKRLLSFGLIVVIGLLLLTSLVVSAFVAYVGTTWFSGAGEFLAHLLEIVFSLGLMTLLFAMTFKILPARRIPWGDVLLGSFITAVLFTIGKLLIGLYIGKSAVASSYGAAGTIVVAIIWVYYSAQIFFLGAEFTRAYSHEHGSKSLGAAANSEFGTGEAAMLDRARKIVKGKDPVLLQKR
ncbi:MAG TPA: YihY/virulence factor BrkB family protein [Usitatibacter sp.]|nr:YihY/virulence factor BrkB family protein [Usitatibacter sp.]